jgi:cation transport ATPase
MFLTTLIVVGTIAYVGVKTMSTELWRTKRKETPTSESDASSADVSVTVMPKPWLSAESFSAEDIKYEQKQMLAEQRYRAVATASLWLTVGGTLFPILKIVSIPLTVYSTLPIFESSFRSLFAEGKFKPATVSSALIVGTLLTDHYLSAALLTWIHHRSLNLGRHVRTLIEQTTSGATADLVDKASQVFGNPPRSVWKVHEHIEVQIPFAQLQSGDVIVVSQGEFIPVDGTVTGGEALVNMVLLSGSGASVPVNEGEFVYARAFVTDGRIQIRVDK